MKRKVTRRAQILIFIWHLHLFFLFSLFYLYTSHIQTCAHTCTHKPVYIPTCAYLIISRVSENTCSESLEVHREKKAAFSVVLPEMLCRISPYRVIIKECVWKCWKCPYSSPSAPHTRHGTQNISASSQYFLCLAVLKACCPYQCSTVSVYLGGGILLNILSLNTCSYKVHLKMNVLLFLAAPSCKILYILFCAVIFSEKHCS